MHLSGSRCCHAAVICVQICVKEHILQPVSIPTWEKKTNDERKSDFQNFAFCNLLLWCVHWPDGDGELSGSGFALPHQEHPGVLPSQTLFSLKSGHTSHKPPTEAHTSTVTAISQFYFWETRISRQLKLHMVKIRSEVWINQINYKQNVSQQLQYFKFPYNVF